MLTDEDIRIHFENFKNDHALVGHFEAFAGVARDIADACERRAGRELAATDEVLIAIKRPEGYEDVAPELVAEDFINASGNGFEWHVVEQEQSLSEKLRDAGFTVRESLKGAGGLLRKKFRDDAPHAGLDEVLGRYAQACWKHDQDGMRDGYIALMEAIAKNACQIGQDDTKRLDWIECQDLGDLAFSFVVDAEQDGKYMVYVNRKAAYSESLRGAIDAAMSFTTGVGS